MTSSQRYTVQLILRSIIVDNWSPIRNQETFTLKGLNKDLLKRGIGMISTDHTLHIIITP